MKADIGIMQNAVRVVSARSEYARSWTWRNAGAVWQQRAGRADYTGEAFNSFKLAQNLKDLPGVHVPNVFPELSTSRC